MPPISDAKRAANRENARKSTGPKTRLGKATSRLNALKHGMTAAVAVPEELREEAENRVAEWKESMCPQEGAEAWLVERAAMDSVRVDAAARCEKARLALRMQREALSTKADGLDDVTVHQMGKKLLESKRPDPAVILELRSTRAGCDWMITRFADIQRRHKSTGAWTIRELYLTLLLMGVGLDDDVMTSETALLLADFLLCKEDHLPEHPIVLGALALAGWDFWSLLAPNEQENTPETIERANVRLSQFLDHKITELVNRRAAFYETDARETELSSDGLLADFSPEGKLLHRYETELLRRMHQSLDLLSKLRKSRVDESSTPSKPSRNEATAPVSLPLKPSLPIRVPLAASSLDDASTIQILCSESSRNEATASMVESTELSPATEVNSTLSPSEPLPNRPRNEANRPQPFAPLPAPQRPEARL